MTVSSKLPRSRRICGPVERNGWTTVYAIVHFSDFICIGEKRTKISRSQQRNSSRCGFTLIELSVFISIIAILIALTIRSLPYRVRVDSIVSSQSFHNWRLESPAVFFERYKTRRLGRSVSAARPAFLGGRRSKKKK